MRPSLELKPKNQSVLSGTGPKRSRAYLGRRYSSRNFHKNDTIYAALDLGTNSCRLTLAAPENNGSFKIVDTFSRIVRLGEGLDKNKYLSEAAMDRAVSALKICNKKMKLYPVYRSRLVTTAACRMAENTDYFLKKVYKETGLKLEVVDEHTEAMLAVSGCRNLVGQKSDAVLLFDIGGGSSEIVLIDFSKKKSAHLVDNIIAWISLPIGVVTLSEYFSSKSKAEDSFEEQVAFVSSMLQNFAEKHKLAEFQKRSGFYLLGTSGTITTLASIYLNLPRYDRQKIDGMWMKSADIETMIKKLLSWDWQTRATNPCIGVGRADLILAGCAIFEAIRRSCPSNWVRIADRGIREGILTNLMFKSNDEYA